MNLACRVDVQPGLSATRTVDIALKPSDNSPTRLQIRGTRGPYERLMRIEFQEAADRIVVRAVLGTDSDEPRHLAPALGLEWTYDLDLEVPVGARRLIALNDSA